MAEERKGPRRGGRYVNEGGKLRRLEKDEALPKASKKSTSKSKPTEPKPDATDTAE